MKSLNTTARFDTRLTLEQKSLLEYAAKIGGYRSLSEFILSSAEARAKEIVDEHNRILATKEDCEIFFKALLNPPKPNKALKTEMKKYKASLKK